MEGVIEYVDEVRAECVGARCDGDVAEAGRDDEGVGVRLDASARVIAAAASAPFAWLCGWRVDGVRFDLSDGWHGVVILAQSEAVGGDVDEVGDGESDGDEGDGWCEGYECVGADDSEGEAEPCDACECADDGVMGDAAVDEWAFACVDDAGVEFEVEGEGVSDDGECAADEAVWGGVGQVEVWCDDEADDVACSDSEALRR